MDKYVVVYRTGGTHHCIWHRVFNTFDTLALAQETACKIERMGYKTNVYTVREIEVVGMPLVPHNGAGTFRVLYDGPVSGQPAELSIGYDLSIGRDALNSALEGLASRVASARRG